MALLERTQRALVEAHDTNASTFSACLYALEAQVWMLRQVVEEQARCLGENAKPVNWKELEERYKKFVEESQAAPVQAVPEYGDAAVFGG